MNPTTRVPIPRGACRVVTSTFILCSALLAGSSPLQAANTPESADKDRVPEGVSASDWQRIRAAHEAWQHAVEPVKGGWQARNPAQQWTTIFDGRGFEAKPQSADWTWGLELRSYGAGEEQREVGGKPAVKTEGHRLAYHWDDTVQEWYVNDGRGLEHGFSVQERPPGPADAPLTFVLATRGPLRAAVTGDARAVDYRDRYGNTVLTYSGLRVWDADGRELEARFASAKGGVALQVDAKDARYPLVIDPVAEQARLTFPATAEDFFGSAAAISGDTVVVGAPFETNQKGAAYVFVRTGATWTLQGVLAASNGGNGDLFGSSLAISGDTIVVGARFEASNATGINSSRGADNSARAAGAAYVFVRNGTVWTQQAYLKASNTGADDFFGRAVAVSGNAVVVGAPFEDNTETGVNPVSQNQDTSGFNSGAAYVFVRNGTTWTQRAYLKASNAGRGDRFGEVVAVSSIGGTFSDTVLLAVGAPGESSRAVGIDGDQNNNSLANSGAVYVFRSTKSKGVFPASVASFFQEAYLKASNTGANEGFGMSLAMDGRSDLFGSSSVALVVGAPGINAGTPLSGAAYLFGRTEARFGPATWKQDALLKASNAQSEDSFGYSVALANVGDTVVIGAPGEDSNATGINGNQLNNSAAISGAAYFFARDPVTGQFSQRAYLKSSQSGQALRFGHSVVMDGSTAIVGGTTGRVATIISGLEPIPIITSAATASGVTGTSFSYQITTTAVADNYAATGLPAGLTIDANTGAITGAPTAVGTFNVDLSASNAAGTDTATLTLSVTVAPPPLPRINSPTTATGQVDVPFNYQTTTIGLVDSYAASGLPEGLTIDANTGAITGTPTAVGTFSVGLSASNAGGTGTATLTLTVAGPPAPVITSATTASGQVDALFNYQITTSTGTPDSLTADGLPEGLSLNQATGAITGTPTAAGTFSVTLSATNSGGTDAETLTLIVATAPQTIIFKPKKTQKFRRGREFTLTATASSGLPVEFRSSNERALSIAGRTATILRRGPVAITARQGGNENYRPAPPVSREIEIE